MLKVHLRRSFMNMADEYFLWEHDREGHYVLHWDREKRMWSRDLVGKGECVAIPLDLEPSFLVPHGLSQQFAQSMIEELSGEGFVSDRHEGTLGKLDVMKGHLEDMRKIAFEDGAGLTIARDFITKLADDLDLFRRRQHDDSNEIARLNRVRETNECELRGLHAERRDHLLRIERAESDFHHAQKQLQETTIALNRCRGRHRKKR